ncbi:hypothetical protein DFH28DRAFT_1028004, partial [Melampsora americana]
MLEIQSLYIKSYEIVTENRKTFVRYPIEITTRLKSYIVKRRYSEFEQLRLELSTELEKVSTLDRGKSLTIHLPSLPPKTRGFFGYLTGSGSLPDSNQLLERQQALERWLKAIIINKEFRAITAQSPSLSRFLNYERAESAPTSNGTIPSEELNRFTPQTWLIEHNDLKAAIREIYSLLEERDQLIQQRLSNPAGSSANSELRESNRLSVEAKRQLVSVTDRVGDLLKSLQQFSRPKSEVKMNVKKVLISVSEGELERRSKLVTSLQDDCEKLSKLTVFARTQAGVASRGRVEGPIENSEQRQELLGGNGSGRGVPTIRVLGGGASRTGIAEETAVTRGLDNRGLMNYQVHTKIVEEQDTKLKSLTEILQRQKMIGMLINNELVEQNEILDEFGNEIDSTTKKLKEAKKKMSRL